MQAVEIVDETDLTVTLQITHTPPEGAGRIIRTFLDGIDARWLEGQALGVEPTNAVRGALKILHQLAETWESDGDA